VYDLSVRTRALVSELDSYASPAFGAWWVLVGGRSERASSKPTQYDRPREDNL